MACNRLLPELAYELGQRIGAAAVYGDPGEAGVVSGKTKLVFEPGLVVELAPTEQVRRIMMWALRYIDERNLNVRVEFGVMKHNMQSAAEARDLVHPSESPGFESCTIGGNVAASTERRSTRFAQNRRTGRWRISIDAWRDR